MVKVPNKIATGLENIDKEPNVEVPADKLKEMQEWAKTREYNDDNMVDIHRVKEFGEYTVDREHFHGHEDDVTVTTENRLSALLLSDFLEL